MLVREGEGYDGEEECLDGRGECADIYDPEKLDGCLLLTDGEKQWCKARPGLMN